MTTTTRACRALLLPLVIAAGATPALAADPEPVTPFVPAADDAPALSGAWERWDAKGIDDYVITVRRSCYCPPTPAVRTVIRNDRIVEVTRGDKRLGPVLGYSMDEMFTRIREAQRTADRVEVEHTRRGVPASITIDPIENAADEETYYTVRVSRLR